MMIFGLPLVGPMFVPILSALLLVMVTCQLVYAGKHLRTISPKLPDAKKSAPVNVKAALSTDSDNSVKKKKKSCCGSKGACCQTKKADGLTVSEFAFYFFNLAPFNKKFVLKLYLNINFRRPLRKRKNVVARVDLKKRWV
jgi:hypothetical protein